ncbi:PREDICTED: uncharacterized protein LOC105967960 [Erythranthe guttata]|uniref:uncharacterized protein LOC105967960 n=1 Tax=Erythranthe guttata TaxID=4155 RepID=UPI00064DC065|nr:PREDICTED: uncharacterized protein LOC105967960 [Erythranthe guttata]|eukprot:XP_012848001.1 PREDICTED: uncharacterized protein LOC105967960 [Erythranthe guttata]
MIEERSSPSWESQWSSPASKVRESLQKTKAEEILRDKGDYEELKRKGVSLSPLEKEDTRQDFEKENTQTDLGVIDVLVEEEVSENIEVESKGRENCKSTPPIKEKEGSDSRANPFEEVENDMIQPCIEVTAELTGVQTPIVHANEVGDAIHEDCLVPTQCDEGVYSSLIIDGVSCTNVTSCLEYSRTYELQLFEHDHEIWFLLLGFRCCSQHFLQSLKAGFTLLLPLKLSLFYVNLV